MAPRRMRRVLKGCSEKKVITEKFKPNTKTSVQRSRRNEFLRIIGDPKKRVICSSEWVIGSGPLAFPKLLPVGCVRVTYITRRRGSIIRAKFVGLEKLGKIARRRLGEFILTHKGRYSYIVIANLKEFLQD